MKTSHKLTFKFDPCLLQKDLNSILTNWEKHFNTNYYEGEWSGIPLREPVSKFHDLSTGNEDSTYQDTKLLARLPYFREALKKFHCEKTSVRLLRLKPGSFIKEHRDIDLSFFHGNVRLHIPIVTHERVEFVVDGKKLLMKPGECWFAEFCKPHHVGNHSTTDRVHLIIDLKVNDWLTNLFEKEGIIEPGEQSPEPMDTYSKDIKLEMVEALLSQNTTTSVKMARKILKKYQLKI